MNALESHIQNLFTQRGWQCVKLDDNNQQGPSADFRFSKEGQVLLVEAKEIESFCALENKTKTSNTRNTELGYKNFTTKIKERIGNMFPKYRITIYSIFCYHPRKEEEEEAIERFISFLKNTIEKIDAGSPERQWMLGNEIGYHLHFSFTPQERLTEYQVSIYPRTPREELIEFNYSQLEPNTKLIKATLKKAASQLAASSERETNPTALKIIILRFVEEPFYEHHEAIKNLITEALKESDNLNAIVWLRKEIVGSQTTSFFEWINSGTICEKFEIFENPNQSQTKKPLAQIFGNIP